VLRVFAERAHLLHALLHLADGEGRGLAEERPLRTSAQGRVLGTLDALQTPLRDAPQVDGRGVLTELDALLREEGLHLGRRRQLRLSGKRMAGEREAKRASVVARERDGRRVATHAGTWRTQYESEV
jgi:hypothetical protein